MYRCAMIAALAGLSVAPAAVAGVEGATGSTTLFGRTYNASRWDLAGDLGQNNAGTANRLIPVEALAVRNGVLYVGGDSDPGQFEGRFLRYNAGATGNLSAPQVLTFSNPGVGPEGFTFNPTSSGFGAGQDLVFVESSTPTPGRLFGSVAISGSTGTTTEVSTTYGFDDVTYLPSTGRFASLGRVNDAGNRSVNVYDSSFSLISGAGFSTGTGTAGGAPNASAAVQGVLGNRGGRGLVAISAQFVTGLTGVVVPAGDYLLIPNDRQSGGDVANSRRLGIFGLDGSLVASTVMPFFGSITAGDVQGITVDEVNNLIYVGDQGGRIWVVQVPTPGAAGVLGLAGLVALRRRRA